MKNRVRLLYDILSSVDEGDSSDDDDNDEWELWFVISFFFAEKEV